jgi:hypothetical protein
MGKVAKVSPEIEAEAFEGLHGDPDIFKHREFGEYVGQLKGTPHAQFGSLGRVQVGDVPSFQKNGSLGGFVLAGEHVEKGRLAGAVGADNGLEGEGLHAEVHIVHGYMPAETDSQVPGFDYWGFDYWGFDNRGLAHGIGIGDSHAESLVV